MNGFGFARQSVLLCVVLLLAACSDTPATSSPTVSGGLPTTLPTTAPTQVVLATQPPPTLAPTTLPTAVAATLVPSTATPIPPTPTPLPQQLFVDTPPSGTLIGSPVVLTGRSVRPPNGGVLNYRVVAASGQELGTGQIQVLSAADGSGSFTGQLNFTTPRDGGTVRAELIDRNSDGSAAATATIELFVAAQYQTITIDTPPAGTQVGSPVVLTGRLARTPFQSRLNYIITNSAKQQIGAGTLNVGGQPGRPAPFTGSLNFNPPLNGDTITVQLYDQDPANGAIVASQLLNLLVAPTPQQIFIDSPPAGTIVGSPMVVTGRTVRFPFSGTLNYRVTDVNGVQIGAGTFAVVGNTDSSTQFNTQVVFQPPRDGGTVRVTIYDQNPSNGAVVVNNSLDVEVLPQYQAIYIDTPPPSTQVGSPVVLTGRTNLRPTNGQLRYRVVDERNVQIGAGNFAVDISANGRGIFTAQLTFAEPTNGGQIRVELSDASDNGAILAQTVLALAVAPPPPPQILIDTPAPGTEVGSPVVLTGRTTYLLANNRLSYRVRDEQNTVIGQGDFLVIANGRQATFTGSLNFTVPPTGGNISIEIYSSSPVPNAPPVSSLITLFVRPTIQPR